MSKSKPRLNVLIMVCQRTNWSSSTLVPKVLEPNNRVSVIFLHFYLISFDRNSLLSLPNSSNSTSSHSLLDFQPKSSFLHLVWSYFSLVSCISFLFYLSFGFLKSFWGFSKLMRLLQNFWVDFCLNEFKSSCIASHLHFNKYSCIFRCVFTLLQVCMLVGLEWAEPIMSLLLHVTCLCIFHTYIPIMFPSFWY